MAAELHTEGLQFLLEVALTEQQTTPANFYIGLATDASLAEGASLSSLTEVSGTGYARQAVASDNVDITSATAGTDDRKATTKTVTFTAAGNWTGANTAFLCTVTSGTSGKLIASAPLSTTRTLTNGDSLTCAIAVQLNG
jgi:hypothetical protein